MYMSRKDYNNAVRYYDEALRVYFTVNDKFEIAHMKSLLGATYIAKKDRQTADTYLNDSLSLFQEVKSRYWEAQTYRLVG